MKCFPDLSSFSIRRMILPGCVGLLLVPMIFSGARATEAWRNSEAGSGADAALYRWMPMPVSKVLGLRPPKEATPLISKLIEKQPTAELYSLRALNQESALDFAAAEADWKKYVESSADHIEAQWSFADFYHRRLRSMDEIAALGVIARAPDVAAENRTPIEQRRSWRAFDRMFKVIGENALGVDVSKQTYQAWIARFPERSTIYERYLQFLLDHKAFGEAESVIAKYHAAAPGDEVFPVKARALLEYRRGSVEQGLAIYDSQFQPLWPQELIDSYFSLMQETRSLRKFLDRARAEVERDPGNLNSAARIFYYYQRQGRSDAAQQALTKYRLRKEQRGAKWSSQELITLAKLNEGIRDYPEAARYYYALYNTNDRADAQEVALAGLVNVLLDAPEQSQQLGSGDLSMYRDIASMDRGPGFLNGILSLVMNTTSPGYAYSEEQRRAVPYFHRAEAAELIRLFESRFGQSKRRVGLRARLIETYTSYGESGAVIRDAQRFLQEFPADSERERVALLLADAYAREGRAQEEFALYDSELAELGKRSDGVPIGMTTSAPHPPPASEAPVPSTLADAEEQTGDGEVPPAVSQQRRAFTMQAPAPAAAKSAQAWYSDYLERYLSRLASMKQLPQALAVLRREVDRNPNDPGLYERLALFLEQNRLGQQQEEVYERAIQQFPDRSWYHKLARFYLREKRNADFARLSEQVTKIFSGTELEAYFSDVVSGREYYTRLNEFAAQRFPHDLMFVRNLLAAYRKPQPERWESLLRQHWWQAEDLRDQFFEFLSRSGKLDAEIARLREVEAAAQQQHWNELASGNPVAARFLGEAKLWGSHFEEAAPVITAVAELYPADFELGRRASAVNRSLAAFEPGKTEAAIRIEQNLYQADPGNRDTLARIGDVLADRELLDRAAPYWNRVAQIRPGEPQAYLDAATIYWDYFDFDAALNLLNEGRVRLGDPALYAYEEGAIYESKQDFPRAIQQYVAGALKEHEGSRPYNRLLDLARRKSLRDEVDRATVQITAGASPSTDAIKLRMAVLETQNRPKDVERLLFAIGERTSSLETLEWLEETARQKSLEAVQEKVLEKQAAVTTDPVRKLELRYSLVRFYEGKKDTAQAQRNVEALYRENPKILGVVRSTVDFYWKNKERQRAIDVLLQAVNDSYPELRTQFRYEAAQKTSEAGQYELSRRLLTQLLSEAPYNDQYLIAMADTYSRARDDQGLKNFSLQKIDEFRKSSLAQDEKTRHIAALRRGLIPALTRMKDFAGAVDQYIEIINRYPEDDALISEAALYAQRNGRQQQLLRYYSDVVKQSPKDYRWPMALAKIETQMEDYSAAVDFYATAISIRPDRADLRTSRAELLERLMRFDEAAADYQKLFDLTYHDARYMEKVAELRARQGRTNDAVAAISAALIENRAEKASNYFEAAKRLENWGLTQQARTFAQKGVDLAGRDLLALSDNHEGARVYVEIMTQLRQHEAAYARLDGGVKDATSFVAEVAIAVKQVEKNGIASMTDRQWREHAVEVRRSTARTGMRAAMEGMGKSVGRYFAPEEKTRFAGWLQSVSGNASGDELETRFVPVATAAGLTELQAGWLKQLMLLNAPNGNGYKNSLAQLQTQRMRFDELGAALEAYAQKLTAQQGQSSVLEEAANAYHAGALYDAEFKVLRRLGASGGRLQQRYFEFLLQRSPQELVQLAGSSRAGVGNAACQYVVAHGTPALAQEAVAVRGRALDPVWTKAYSGLVGLYFADRSPAVNVAFHDALGDATIGERLGKGLDRSRQLAGTPWFYYASRYGEWLGLSQSAEAEDFLPAQLEQSPATASGYVSLGEYYADAGKVEKAVEEYRHALELAPERADLHDRVAVLYWRAKKRDVAIAEWKTTLELLNAQVHLRVVPPGFWTTFNLTMNHLGTRHVSTELRQNWEPVLRDYVRQNGTYQVDGLLRSAYAAIGDAQAGVSFMLELASISPEPNSFLEQLADDNWIPKNAKGAIYEQIIARLRDRARSTQEIAHGYEEENLRSWQGRYALYLVEMQQYERAISALPQREGEPTAIELQVRYRIAIANGTIGSVLEQYRAEPQKAPPAATLREVANALQSAGERKGARNILELLFTREIAAHQLNAANMLGLAEIRLQDGDTEGAMQILRRLVLVVGQPFENLDPAATLLSRNGHHAEAVEFLSKLVQAKPWDSAAGVHLAQEQLAAGQDVARARTRARSVASDAQNAYATRLEAAAVAGDTGSGLGSEELDFVATGKGVADRPYFSEAKVLAASKTDSESAARLLRGALADAPGDKVIRVRLFQSLAAASQDRLAISSIEPLLQSGLLGGAYSSYASVPATDEETSDTSDSGDADWESRNNHFSEIAGVDRAALTVAVAKAYANLGAFDTSLRYYRAATKLKLTSDASAEVTRSINAVRATMRRNASNATRMPIIHAQLEQQHLVHARLIAESKVAPSNDSVTKKGGRAQ